MDSFPCISKIGLSSYNFAGGNDTETSLHLVSPTYCACPKYNFNLGDSHYFFGSEDASVFVDRDNQKK